MSGATETEYIDLFSILPPDVPMENHCVPGDYWKWEHEIASPILKNLGFTDIVWGMGEHDSFGPLSRVVGASRDGERHQFVYG